MLSADLATEPRPAGDGAAVPRLAGFGSSIAALVGAVALVAPNAASASPSAVPIRGSISPVAAHSPRVGSVAGDTSVDFEVELRIPDQQAADAFANAASTPGSADYGRYLTATQWEQRFSPSADEVDQVTAFLKQNGFTVLGTSADRLAISASGTAAQVERAFSTSLSYHRVRGLRLRFADKDLSVPSDLAGTVIGVAGVSDTLAHPDRQTGGPTRSSPASPSSSGDFAQPPGFRVAPPCSAYYDQPLDAALDAALPPFGSGYPANAPWAVCGYTPPQFRSAYNLSGPDDGSGVTVAVVDAYASPTIFSDAKKYASLNDPGNPLRGSRFSQQLANSFNDAKECDPGGWFGEETLDVESVHATAPGASILYAGAKNCNTRALDDALRSIVDHHRADVITNSYGHAGGDTLDTAGDRAATDNILEMAAATGISVMFSSGDDGDEFTTLGSVLADYPSSSPWATAVGGTTLQIGSAGQRIGEYGWSTARSFFCNAANVAQQGCSSSDLGTWGPIDQSLDGGSGGGTSFVYSQPFYQRGIVPTALSERNASTVGPQPMRVEPDISMDGDPATGILVGETQTFPDGVYYDQYRTGGTSVSSGLFAGVVARADELAGRPLGFLNPALYSLSGRSNAIHDVRPSGKQDQSRADYADEIDSADGILYSTRIIDYEGPETFCDTNDNCSTRKVAISTARGFDAMTGLGAPTGNFVRALANR
jgi:subtilase family serine protease